MLVPRFSQAVGQIKVCMLRAKLSRGLPPLRRSLSLAPSGHVLPTEV
jgi:hypothetical protein